MKWANGLVIAAGVMVAMGLASCNNVAHSSSDDVEARLEFGLRVAGTYVGPAETDKNPGVPFLDVLTFAASGTYVGTSEDGDPANGSNSPEHGAWERIGQREIAFASVILSFDATGREQYVFRVDGSGTFDSEFNELSGTFVNRVFRVDQDPLRDEPIATRNGSVVLKRLRPSLDQ